MYELVQFRTDKKKELKAVAKKKHLSVNTFLRLLIEDYLKKVENENWVFKTIK